jgi:hypothetical protein
MKSLLATFSNSQTALGPAEGYFCAQNVDDTKLLQILCYIKSCDGALDLLWNFIHEHADLLSLQNVTVSQDTIDWENRKEEESRNLDVELHSDNDVQPAQSQEGQFSQYGDETLEVNYQGKTGVKPPVENSFGEQNVGALEEDRENDFVLIYKNVHELQSAEVKQEITDLHTDVEDNPYKEVEDSVGGNNLERAEVKREISDLYDVESDSTAAHSEVEDNPYKEVEDSVGENNLEGAEVKREISDLYDVESDSTAAHSDVEDNPNKEVEDSVGENNLEGSEVKKEISDLFDVQSDSTVTRSDVEDNPYKKVEDCHGDGCYMNGCICGAEQYHHRLEDNLIGDGTGESVRCIVELIVDTRNGLTGCDVKAEEISELYAETKGSKTEKGAHNPVVETSSDILSGYPVSPRSDMNNDGETYLVPECVQGGFISHFKDHEHILDPAQLNTEENETHCGTLEGDQREEIGKQGCPVWQILKHLECPFKWVPDIFIRRTPHSKIQENMIDHLTGKPTDAM